MVRKLSPLSSQSTVSTFRTWRFPAELLTCVFALLSSVGLDCRQITEAPEVTTVTDTTSHDFVWKWETLGYGEPLYDAAIVNDTSFWAVGGVSLSDPRGNTAKVNFNLAKCDGNEWSFEAISYSYYGQLVLSGLWSVYCFSERDAWVAGDRPMHWNGTSWKVFDIPASVFNGCVYRMWGTGSTNMYLAGANGSFAHYYGVSWKKIISGTDVPLRDISGSAATGAVWLSGFSYDNTRSVLLKSAGGICQTIWSRQGGSTPPFGDLVSSVWTSSFCPYVTSNQEIYSLPQGGSLKGATALLRVSSFPYHVRGNDDNDIFVVGSKAMIWHYNGAGWKLLFEGLSYHYLYAVAVSRQIVVAVGGDYSAKPVRTLVVTGRRIM